MKIHFKQKIKQGLEQRAKVHQNMNTFISFLFKQYNTVSISIELFM